MQRTITRLFDSHEQAQTAVRELEAAGVPADDISLIARDGREDPARVGEKRSFGSDDRTGDRTAAEAGEDAGKGAAVGGVLGAGAGLLAGLGVLAIPGLGPVVAAGWLASAAVGAVAGGAVGGAAGGLLGALQKAGVDDADANVYAEGVRRGGTLVAVRTDEGRAAQAEAILDRNAGVNASARGAVYRQEGWTGYRDEPGLGAGGLGAQPRTF